MSASTQGCPSSGSDKPSVDTDLVIRAKAGDADAFEGLYAQLYNPICIFLIHMNEELESIERVSVAGPEEEIEAKERLMEALGHIRWKSRACLLLYHKENYSIPQIARLVGIQESSVKTYISNGIKALQNFLKDDDTPAKGGRGQ